MIPYFCKEEKRNAMRENIVLAEDFGWMDSEEIRLYCTHALCHEGEATFHVAGQRFRIGKGDCVIFTHSELVTALQTSADFRATVLYLLNDYALKNMPRNDYDVIGKMTLLRNPVLPLTEREQEIFMEDVRLISRRLTEIGHRFHNDLMGCLVEAFCLDLYDFHARRYAPPQLGKQSAVILTKFLNMLKEGACEQHREVSYYASKLCITPKYLSEISKKVSGFGANAWIDRFAIVGIARLLACKDIPLKAIADRYRFSSLPYFSRYVQKQLGVPPSEYRKSLE